MFGWMPARRRDGVVLLVDGLLPGRHPEVRGDAHGHMNHCGPTVHPVSDPGKVGLACDTRKSDSATCTDLMPAVQAVPGPGCLETRHVRAKDKGSSARAVACLTSCQVIACMVTWLSGGHR